MKSIILFQKIVNQTILEAGKLYKNLQFENFQSAYRRFDPVRGMDYRIFINFQDTTKNELILKRLHNMYHT